jgi:SAM-dependent methyltransferase
MQYGRFASWYDAENEHHAMLREDVPFFLNQLPRRKQRILEIGAGTGRCAIPMAQSGHRVVGIDHDPGMIEIALRHRAAAGLDERRLELRTADALTLRLPERFDWVVALFNTFLAFTTLAQQDTALETARRHLKPTGRLWLDLVPPNLSLLSQPHWRDLDPTVFFVPALDSTVVKTIDIDRARDRASQVQHVTYRFRWCDRRGRAHMRKMSFDMTFLFPRELQMLLERNGFELEQLWGNYDGSPVTHDSPRLIARCRLAGPARPRALTKERH